MTYGNYPRILLLGAALGLAACGGGGGGGGGVNSTPTPTPTPTLPLVAIIPNVTASTEFAVLGIEVNTGTSNLTTDGFSVRYDAPTRSYIMDFPSTAPGAFRAGGHSNDWFWNGTLVPGESVSVRKTTNPDLPLTYTTLATYGFEAPHFGWLAFGSATPAGGVPVTGTASYSAEVRGWSVGGSSIEGTATLDFNFGAGDLSGHLDPLFGSTSLGRYDFINTVYGSGSTSFSGELSKPELAQNGTFTGQFTGPIAQELMARWSAPYIDPVTTQQSTMFGVWVGKR